MFKQKTKYVTPDTEMRWVVTEKVVTASPVSFGDTGSVSSESFTQDDEVIYF